MRFLFEDFVAKEFGISSAVLFESIAYWISYNIANNKHYYDGEYWTYNSVDAYEKLFPFLTKRQIRTALDKLLENDVIRKGCYNKTPYDRTAWYSLTEKGKLIAQKCNFDLSELTNESDGNDKPIPLTNTFDNTNICSGEKKEETDSKENDRLQKLKEEMQIKADFEAIYNTYPKKGTKQTAFEQYKKWVQKSGRKEGGKTYHLNRIDIYRAVRRYIEEKEANNTDLQYYKNFATLMGKSLIDYLEE